MNFFFQHIEYLLLRHDCVIVPGLGAFIATAAPAVIDMEKGVITPPSRTLMFNQSVSIDDGLIASSIARKAGISFEEARNVTVRCVTAIKDTLSSNKEIKIGSLGKLISGEEGNLLFAPHSLDFSSSHHMGYHALSIHAAPRQTESENKTQPAQQPSTTDASETYSFGFSKLFSRVAVMIAVIAAVALTVILNPLPASDKQQKASVVPVETLLKSACETKNEPDTLVVAQEKQSEQQPSLPRHYLIVATFANKEEAEKYARVNSTEEYPLSTVSSKKMTRVSVAASDVRDELRKKLNSPGLSSRFPNSWIWSMN